MQYLAKNGIETPYRKQSLAFWRVMKAFVNDFLSCYYSTPDELAEDVEVWRFCLSILKDVSFTSASSLAEGVGTGGIIDTAEHLWFFTTNLITRCTSPDHLPHPHPPPPPFTLHPPPSTCPPSPFTRHPLPFTTRPSRLTLTSHPQPLPSPFTLTLSLHPHPPPLTHMDAPSDCYLVTAGHEHVGTVPAYAQDVSFCAFNWPKGELCGTKQTAITSAVLMAFTSTPMPMLMAEIGSEVTGLDRTHLPWVARDPRAHQPCVGPM